MAIDDPRKPEFASWRSYQEFAKRVRHRRRYVWEKEVKAFLNTVLATLKDRDVKISKGTIFYRAQRGVRYDRVFDEDGNEIEEATLALGPERMKPLENRAREGRANPAGIPVLYLASAKLTAISEVRPWIGSELSVAQFKIARELKSVNLSLGHGQTMIGHLTFANLSGEQEPNSETKEKAVWIDIDNAFSSPVTHSDDAAEYVPTQILAELFKDTGYDAILYRSQFGETGYNITLFDVEDAEIINATPFRVTGIDVKCQKTGNPWFSRYHWASSVAPAHLTTTNCSDRKKKEADHPPSRREN